ncbi:MAG: hypothetical protein MI743_21660 [Sneathiellales bacterium]|nr:hypothetical protein [Sneathiellales bacterium]
MNTTLIFPITITASLFGNAGGGPKTGFVTHDNTAIQQIITLWRIV